MRKKLNKVLFMLLNACIIIPVIYYYSKVNTYALNIPYGDDYDAVLAFLNKFVSAGYQDKISMMFSQHNEHRILLSRIIFVLFYKIYGFINFRSLIFIANFELVFIFVLIVYFISKSIPGKWNIAALVLSICLFDTSNFENADFAMAGIQNYGVILLFLLGIFFYNLGKKKYLVPAVFFQAMVVFSSGNGVIGAFLIVFFAILLKDKLKIIISFTTLAIFGPLYFLHYTGSAMNAGSAPGQSIIYFIRQTGAVFNFDYSLYFGIGVLILLAITIPVTKKMHIIDNTAPIVSLLLFILASMATVAYFRSSVEGIFFYTSRYLIYPHLLTGIVFIFGFIKLKEKKIRLPAAIAFILAMVTVYIHNTKWGEEGLYVEYYRLTNFDFVYPDEERARKLSNESCRLKIYCIEQYR